MAEERAQRRLAAILAADVVGYSRLMQADEAGTLAGLKARRSQVLQPVVSKHRGRIVKLMGDGVLVEFASAVDAVDCAVQLQEAMGAANVGVPKDRQIVLRIGINLGDVMVEGSDLYGDGVNIAARLEALAEPGGVLVSNKVRSEVAAKLNVAFDDLGEQKLKNMTDPVRVYRVSGGAAASAPSPAPRSSKPSIAVLPFTNMSGDPEQEYFSDGITEDIITDLSKIGGLMVIARNSSFAYKGNATNIRVVARELGVRSVLEGSIRRAGGRVRITAQLIDGETGGHLWAERFDRELTDIFAVQDEVTRRIVDALKIALSPGEAAALAAAETTNSKAHDLFLAGREFLFAPTRNRETFDRSTDLFAKAIVEDPSYGEPYAGAAFAQLLNWQNHWTNDWSRSLESAERSISLALQKSPQSAFVHYTAAVFFFWNKDLDRSAAEADAALDLNPNYANALSTRSLACIYGGQPLAAVPYIQQGFRLDPTTKHVYLHFLGSAYLLASDYRTAATVFRERIQLSPKTDLSRAFLAVALGHLGEVDEAQRVWRELMEINPKYSFTDHVGRLPFRDRADADRLAEGLSKAGISA
jgi:adenylate cyclase